MNRVEIIGRVTKDPEVKYGASNQNAYCRMSVAIDRGKDKSGNDLGADFPSVIAFGKTAENCERYLKKGRLIAVQGMIHTGKYEKDGHAVYTTDIYADRVEFLEWGDKEDEKKPAQDKPKEQQQSFGGFTQLNDDDIPF